MDVSVIYVDAGVSDRYARTAWVRLDGNIRWEKVKDYSLGCNYTINDLEYMAIVEALSANIDCKRVQINSDSQLVVKQYQGEYQVKQMKFMKYILDIERLSKHREVRIEWIRRGKNLAGIMLENIRVRELNHKIYLQR